MKHSDFKIGGEFTCGSGDWRCTDVGSRTVVAILLDRPNDPSFYAGPPYAVEQEVFDEADFGGCEPAPLLQESVATPGVQSETGQVLTGEPAEKNPLDNHHPDWVRQALWCIKEGDFLQVAQAFTYLVETSNDWEELQEDPVLLLLADRIYKWGATYAPKPLTYQCVMASDSELLCEIDSEACEKAIQAWLEGKGK